MSFTVTVAVASLPPMLFDAETEILTVEPFDTPSDETGMASEPPEKSDKE